MRLYDYLSDCRYIAYSPDLGKIFGPNAAILLCWVIWRKRESGALVEATVAQIGDETGLSERNIETAKRQLEGVLVVTQKRLEHRTFYSVDAEELEKRWVSSRESAKRPFERKSESSCPESAKRPFELEERTSLRTEESPLVPQGGIALGAATPRKRCTVKPKPEPSPQATEMVRTFAAVYASHFRSAYVPNARKDLPGAESLVLAGVTTEQVRERADAAMRSKGFNCRRATTLALLAELWNNIGGELQDGQRTDHQQSSEAAWGKKLELPMLRV